MKSSELSGLWIEKAELYTVVDNKDDFYVYKIKSGETIVEKDFSGLSGFKKKNLI